MIYDVSLYSEGSFNVPRGTLISLLSHFIMESTISDLFPTGSFVRLRRGLVTSLQYGGLTLRPVMRFSGYRLTSGVSSSGNIYLHNNKFGYWYSPEMLIRR